MACSIKAWLSLTASVGCLLSVRTASAQSALPSNWLSAQVNESGQACALQAEQRQGDQLWLACGAAGVWQVSFDDQSPRLVRSYAFAGDAIGFIIDTDERLWVKLNVLEARPLWGAATRGAVTSKAMPPMATPSLAPIAPVQAPALAAPSPVVAGAPRKLGHVERTESGAVVISLGTADGISRGDHIEFAAEVAAAEAGAEASEEAALSSDIIAIGVVTNVSAHSARVRLGLNESVPAGALAGVTASLTTASLSAPPRVSGRWELELMARPFAALDQLGGGILMSGSFGYRFSQLHLQVVLDPLGLAAVENEGDVATINAAAIASYDSHYFEMGLGFGFQTVNETSFLTSPGSGLTAVQLIRLGARDGLSLTARTNIALFHSEFQFGGMVASGQIPLTRGYWLLLNGGGGNVGYGFGELGLRVLLAGNGFAGSKFLTVTAGGVGVFKSGTCDEFFSCSEEKSYGGPMAGLGGEWRF